MITRALSISSEGTGTLSPCPEGTFITQHCFVVDTRLGHRTVSVGGGRMRGTRHLSLLAVDRGLFGHGDFRYNHSSERRVLEGLFFSIDLFWVD